MYHGKLHIEIHACLWKNELFLVEEGGLLWNAVVSLRFNPSMISALVGQSSLTFYHVYL